VRQLANVNLLEPLAIIALKSSLHGFSYLWDMKDSSKILGEIKRLVLAQDPTAKIYLYGSRAKGKAQPDSDWDLLILVSSDEVSREVETSITYPLFDLEFETGELISPMVYSEKEWNTKYSITPFYRNIMKEGHLL